MNKKLMLSAVSLSLLTPTIASANMDTGQTIDDTLEEHEHKWNTQINGVNMNVIKGLNSSGELSGTVQLQIYVDESVFNDLTKLKFSTNISEFKLKPLVITSHGTYIYEIPFEKSHEIDTLKIYSELSYVNENFNKSTIELTQYNYEKAIPLYDDDVVEDITYVEGNVTEPIIVPPKEVIKPKPIPSEQKPNHPQKPIESNQETETKETNKSNSSQNNVTPKKPNSNVSQKNNENKEVLEDISYNSSSNSNNMSEVVSISKEDNLEDSNKDNEIEKEVEDVSKEEKDDSSTEEIVADTEQNHKTDSTKNDSEVEIKQNNKVENKDLPKTNTETKVFPLILGAMLIVVGGFVAISQRKRINKE